MNIELKNFKKLKNYSEKNFGPELAVDVRNVVFGYKKNLKILNNINVQIPKGKIYALLGPNGCGKTTLMRLILGLLKPESGSIQVFGREPKCKNSSFSGPLVGYMPQEIALFNEFSIEEIIKFFGLIYKLQKNEIKQRTEHFIQLFNLPEKERKINQLSVGQQRLVSMAVTLIHRPPLVILDEPTAGVDSLIRSQIWKYLINLCEVEGIAVVIITHYTEEARSASTVGFMRSGTLLMQSNPNDLMQKLNASTLEDAFLLLCDQKNLEIIRDKIKSQVEDKEFSNIETDSLPEKNRKIVDFSNLKALLLKSYIRVRENQIPLLLFFLFPIIEIALLKCCIGQMPSNNSIAIFNAEINQNFSQIFIDYIDREQISTKFYDTNETAINSVFNGENWFAITFANHFSENFEARLLEPNEMTEEELDLSEIKLYADLSNYIIGNHIHRQLLSSFEKFLQNISLKVGHQSKAVFNPINLEEVFYGPKYSSLTGYFASSLLPSILHVMPMFLVALVFVAERKYGHLERVFVASVKPTEVLLTNMIIAFIAILLLVLISMIFAFLIFDTPMNGSYFDAFALLVCQSIQGMTFGQFFSLFFSDEFSVLTALNAFCFPLWFTSGLFWPLESVPYNLRMLFYSNPLAIPVESMRSIMLRGWGINNINVLIGFIVSITYTLLITVTNFVIFEKFPTSSPFTRLLNKFNSIIFE